MNSNPLNISVAKPISQPIRQPQNFVEALKSIGGTQRLPQTSIYQPDRYGQSPDSQAGYTRENLFRQEKERRDRHLARHREMMNQSVYDRRETEIKAQIDALRKELQALAKEISSLGISVQKAIEEEIAHPGSYHVAFFEKLRRYLILLRQRVSESQNWLALSSQRMSAKNAYWGNVRRSGTKYMLSSERSIATQTG